ncbi:hypothetical protein [Streptomyces sp. NPDC001970]
MGPSVTVHGHVGTGEIAQRFDDSVDVRAVPVGQIVHDLDNEQSSAAVQESPEVDPREWTPGFMRQ